MTYNLLVSSTAAQASGVTRHVHFDQGSIPAAAGASPGPSGQQQEGDDPFLASTGTRTSHQVSISNINFTFQYSANLTQGGLRSPQDELFNLPGSSAESDGSPRHGAGHGTGQGPTSDPATPTRHSRRGKKAGTRLVASGDDVYQFFTLENGSRQCKYCL